MPALPGLELVNVDPERLRGQVVYLDVDGARNVTYEGSVAVGPFDVPAFEAPGPFAGWEGRIMARVCGSLRRIFADAGVIFTLERPTGDQLYSTVFVGGDDGPFAGYGSFDGLAETVDVGNRNPCDKALVFSAGFDISDPMTCVSRLTCVIAHEVGHLLGYAHRAGDSGGGLGQVAHATGPDDDETVEENGPVHQWLTYNAFLFYNSQFADSGLTQFIGDWQDYGGKHHRTNGDNNDVIEGAFDEDVSAPIVYPFDNGFHWDIVPQNPLGQSIPYERHFVAGGAGDEIYSGWSGYASAVTQALSYWEPYVLATYPTNESLSYYYLGHVAHLLEDMTVPAHVHNDAHPFRDAYEYTMGEHANYRLWGFGDEVRTGPAGTIETPTDLVSLFRETIQYTGEYPSDDVNGDNTPEIPDEGRHRPDLVSRADGFTGDGAVLDVSGVNEITTLADDLMPWAMEKVATLFRFFYRLVDTTAPVVTLQNSFGADEAGAVLKPEQFQIMASARDGIGGYEANGFRFTLEHKIGDSWEPLAVDPNAGTFEFTAPGDGLYRVSVEVRDAAGNVGRSGTGYFRVDQAGGLTPVYRFWSPVSARHFYTIRASERDKLIGDYADVWSYEGVAYYTFATDARSDVAPVYRFWSGSLSTHLYTNSESEKAKLIDLYPDVWTYEGIAFYACAGDTPPVGTSAVYRFWSPVLSSHFFTISQTERNKLLNLYPHIWTYELIAWYAYEA